jgi:non-specific protein-tyrosine kinase
VRGADQEGHDLRYYLRLVWKRKWPLLAVLILIPAAVYGVSRLLPKEYEAQTTIQVQQTTVPSSLFTGGSVTSSSIEGTARLIETTAVARKAARRLGDSPSSARSLLDDVSVSTASATTEENQEFLTIIARADSGREAADIANAFAHAVADTRVENSIGQINGTIRALAQEAAAQQSDSATARELANQLQQLRALRASQASATRVIEPALPPNAPASPRPLRNAAVGFVLALLIAAGLVPLLERLDRRLRDPEDVSQLLDAQTLALIPEQAFPGHQTTDTVREAFQTLRATLTYFNVDRPLRTVMVTSAGNQEGKTTVATNLALALAQDGRDIILVDGDLRRPQAISRFGLEQGTGLDAVLLGEASLERAMVDVEVEGDGRLRVLPGGQGAPNAAVLLGSERMGTLLDGLSRDADMVIVDTPPLLVVADAIPMLEGVSGVVLVVRIDHSNTDAVQRAGQVISSAHGTLLGVAATGTHARGLYDYYIRAPSPKPERRGPLQRKKKMAADGEAIPEPESS